MLTKNIKEIASDLQIKAAKINGVEQMQFSQRAVRQVQGSPSNPARSLSQLTGEPAVFAHLHMWFTWLLSVEPIIEKPSTAPEIPITISPLRLRQIFNEMDRVVFNTIGYCILTGIKVECDMGDVLNAFKQLLPNTWLLPKSGEVCKLFRTNDKWTVQWNGNLPSKLPKLLTLTEEALQNEVLGEEALKHHLLGAVLHWRNVARSIGWIQVPNQEVFQALGVHKWDLPLLAYWSAQCRYERL